MDLDVDGVRPVAGDTTIEFGLAGTDDSIEAAAARRAYDSRQIDVTAKWRANDQQLTGLRRLTGRFVALMLEQQCYAGLWLEIRGQSR